MRTADYYCGDCIPRARTNVEGFATSSVYSWHIALDATLAQHTSSQSDSFNSSYRLMDDTLLAVALGFLIRKRNLLLVRKLFLLQSSDRRAIFFGWAVFRWTLKHKCFKAQTSAPEVPLSHVAMDYPIDAKPPEFRLIFEIDLFARMSLQDVFSIGKLWSRKQGCRISPVGHHCWCPIHGAGIEPAIQAWKTWVLTTWRTVLKTRRIGLVCFWMFAFRRWPDRHSAIVAQ